MPLSIPNNLVAWGTEKQRKDSVMEFLRYKGSEKNIHNEIFISKSNMPLDLIVFSLL